MIHASTQEGFLYHPHCKKLKLTHLLFADDVLIFCKAQIPTLQAIKAALDAFHATTGLQANQTKTKIVLGGCSAQLTTQCIQATGFQEESLPIKYLGVPITPSRLTKLECRILIDKITTRLTTWATKSISFAGRAQLLNFAIFGMYIY